MLALLLKQEMESFVEDTPKRCNHWNLRYAKAALGGQIWVCKRKETMRSLLLLESYLLPAVPQTLRSEVSSHVKKKEKKKP